MKSPTKVALSLACGMLVVSLIGCGGSDRPPLGSVTGTVLIKGQPVEHLLVTFQPAKGKAGQGETDAQGKYTAFFGRRNIEGVPLGKCKVGFVWPTGYEPPAGVSIPEGWGADSETEVEIKAGANTFDFDLK